MSLKLALTSQHSGQASAPRANQASDVHFRCAPSMCLAAYLSCAADPSYGLSCALFDTACPLYFVGFVALFENMRTPFYPTFAAMTFPFVIAATATAKFAAFSQVMPMNLPRCLFVQSLFRERGQKLSSAQRGRTSHARSCRRRERQRIPESSNF